MNIKKIISDAVAKNPVGMKENLEAALKERLSMAIAEKRTRMAEEVSDLGEAEYNADGVDKAIKSADKDKKKPTSAKGKALIHALLKGHSKK